MLRLIGESYRHVVRFFLFRPPSQHSFSRLPYMETIDWSLVHVTNPSSIFRFPMYTIIMFARDQKRKGCQNNIDFCKYTSNLVMSHQVILPVYKQVNEFLDLYFVIGTVNFAILEINPVTLSTCKNAITTRDFIIQINN